MARPFVLFLPLLFLLVPLPLAAWGEHGHRLASEAATRDVPPSIPSFFHRSYPRIIYMGYDPDRWYDSGPALRAANAPNHFLDLEYVQHLDLPPDRYRYLALMESSGTLRSFGIENTKAGFLPWKVAELHDLLAVQWRLWRRSSGDAIAREQIEQNIIAVAGEIGHYVADAANPHHATIHYNGWAAPQESQFECDEATGRLVCRPLAPLPFDCGTHSRFESQFVSRTMTIEQITPHLRPLSEPEDAFEAIMALLEESHSLVPRIYELDRSGGFDGNGSDASREFAASRIAAGASLLRDLWYSAWTAAETDRP